MEKLFGTFEKLNLKVQNIEDAMIVLPHKMKLSEDLCKLSRTDKEIKSLEAAVKTSINEHKEALKKQYDDTTKGICRVQMKMMYLLQHLEDKAKHQQSETRALQEIVIPVRYKMLNVLMLLTKIIFRELRNFMSELEQRKLFQSRTLPV